ncbi:HSP90 family protein [Micromonospora endophytica]|uniref:HSP90 family protein n=1 Tax=Micromonospora endophytica TaxID=515350 RepID=A0A2W2D1W2_9ACTN|nr:HSP90 family protein [Micromonospora endophytica]PZF94609.1 HSP90 family protein [Micromonospora endophytica]RIW44811.1 HSP90 family protein [Micromonospora endophytica]BCJ57535.1 molecular chaperone HtpG [Micromonospora endophytica]
MSHTFHVDLRGIVDLLSHHLYASPRVYVRELMQNAVDAITARRAGDPGAPGEIRIFPSESTGDGTLRVEDSGVGLTEAQVHELLATIGRSSKRDELGFARHEFLGQFGIGLLSCFLVADEIRVRTRAADSPTMEWTGYADGRYELRVAAPEQERAGQGTTVTLVPRRGEEHWLRRDAVVEIAALYGAMLPIAVRVDDKLINIGLPPWETDAEESAGDRRARLDAYAQEVFGFTPFDVIDLAVPAAGLRGVAFVLPVPVNPASRVAHRVYLKQMLLSEDIERLLPEWAFFVRCVIDTGELRPTASREALYEDALLDQVRESLGDSLRGWLTRLGRVDSQRLQAFLRVHHLGVKALAVHDDEMLRLVDQWWPFETNMGPLTLAEFRERYGTVRYTPSVDEFRQLASVAAAQHIAVVNAGYVYDAQLTARLGDLGPEFVTEVLTASDLATRLEPLDPDAALAVRPFQQLAQRTLDPLGVAVLVRAFDPASLPALYLLDDETGLAVDLRAGQAQADELWSSILGSFTAGRDDRPQLVFNHRNPLVRQAIAAGDEELTRLAVEGLYVQALLLGHQPLRPADTAALNQSFLGLLARAMGGQR